MADRDSAGHDAGLGAYADRYFELLGAGDHRSLPLAPGVRFTENGQRLELGTGLWRTVTGVADTRAVTVADPEQHQVVAWGIVNEAGVDVILGVRLRVDDGLITEIETLVARDPMFGQADFPARPSSPSPGFADEVEPAARATRAELIAAGNAYFDGVQDDDADLIPAADDCLRVENGRQTVLHASAAGYAPGSVLHERLKLGVRDQVRTRDFRYIEEIRDRRFPVVDVTRGLVLGLVFFDHPGQLRDAGFPSSYPHPNSMMIWELFQVSGGLIRQIEAIIGVFPYGMRSGWEAGSQLLAGLASGFSASASASRPGTAASRAAAVSGGRARRQSDRTRVR